MVCKKLIKFGLIGAVAVGATSWFLFGEHAGSYLGTMASTVRESVRGKIPVEFELKRAEHLVAEIDPQINQCKRDVARAEVELADLEREIEGLNRTVERDERKLKAGRDILAGTPGEVVYELAGHSYSRQRVELDLARTLEVHRSNVAILTSKQALLERQGKAVDAARVRLDAVRSQKVRLEDQIASLKLQKQQLDAMVASSRRFDLDDTALGQAKEVLERVKRELDVTQRVIEDDLYHAEGLGQEMPRDMDVVKEIDTFFSGREADGDEELIEVRHNLPTAQIR